MIAYALFEVRRTLRNPKFLLLVAAVPVLLYVISVNNARHGSTALGASAAAWYLSSAMVIGVLGGALTGANARLATERASGWYRQLRTTPLGDRRWLVGRLLAGLVVVVPVVVLVAGVAIAWGDVRLPLTTWAALFVILVGGAVPAVLAGLALGLSLRCEAAQAAQAVVFVALALFGGAFADTEAPPSGTRFLVETMPSYHLMNLTREAVSGQTLHASHIAALAAASSLLALLVALLTRRANHL
jgi:ABC-2 type transport system permease protein